MPTFDWSVEPGPWNLWVLFDDWRRQYDDMTLQDQIAFHSEFYKRWTVIHQHGDDRPAAEFFAMFADRPVRVFEVGGWTGEVAELMLANYQNIEHWENVEICREAVETPRTNDPRYLARVPEQWVWDEGQHDGFNVLFMQHVIEHMRAVEFEKLLDTLPDVEYAFIQSPLEMGPHPTQWLGYPGCHIFENGWEYVDGTMADRGFTLVKTWWDTQYSTAPENGRTRIYRRYNAVQQP